MTAPRLNEMDIGFKDKEITELFKLIDKEPWAS